MKNKNEGIILTPEQNAQIRSLLDAYTELEKYYQELESRGYQSDPAPILALMNDIKEAKENIQAGIGLPESAESLLQRTQAILNPQKK